MVWGTKSYENTASTLYILISYFSVNLSKPFASKIYSA